MKTETKKEPIVVKRSLKHVFTPEETAKLNVEFGQAYDNVKSAEADFDAVKAVHKSKITEAESRMTTLRATINAGFEMRNTECVVVFRPSDRKKDLFIKPEDGKELAADAKPTLTEEMTADDFALELFEAEKHFELREEIVLFEAGADKGVVAVGRIGGKWFGAARLTVGKDKLEERLDSEQKASKDRFPAITAAHKRASEWLKARVKDAAKGFEEPMLKAIEAHRERVE